MQFKLPALSALLLFSVTAAADVQLTQADVLGAWQIDKESVHRDGSISNNMSSVWTFKEDGTMEGVSNESDAHARVNQLRAVLNYSIENGKILKQSAPGRSKMETCTAIEKENNKMVLKCQTNYFFMTKK